MSERDVVRKQFEALGLSDYIKRISEGSLTWLDDFYDWRDAYGEGATDKAMQLVGALVAEMDANEKLQEMLDNKGDDNEIMLRHNGQHWHGHIFGHVTYDEKGKPVDGLGWHKVASADTVEECATKTENFRQKLIMERTNETG